MSWNLAFTVARSVIASRLLWWAMKIAPESEKDIYLTGGLHILEQTLEVSRREYHAHRRTDP